MLAKARSCRRCCEEPLIWGKLEKTQASKLKHGVGAHHTRLRPYRWRSNRLSSIRARNSSSAAKLPAMKATNFAMLDSMGDGNWAMYRSAALWLAFSLQPCQGPGLDVDLQSF